MEIVNIIIGLLALVVAILGPLYWYKKKKRAAKLAYSYKVLNIINLDSDEKKDVREHLEVTWKNNKIRKLDAVHVEITNNGDVSFSPADIFEEISVEFVGAKILSAEVIETQPAGLAISLVPNEQKIIVGKTLLNAGDSFAFKILLQEFSGIPKFHTRIKDLTELLCLNEENRIQRRGWHILLGNFIENTIFPIALIVTFFIFDKFIAERMGISHAPWPAVWASIKPIIVLMLVFLTCAIILIYALVPIANWIRNRKL